MDGQARALRAAGEVATGLVHACQQLGLTVATAESCTAGLVASTIAQVPGASEVLHGGAVTYVNEIKHRVLGVSQETLDTVGAVSFDCARQMAEGARRVFGADLAVSVTGYAGPGGGSSRDPVGTVYFGIAAPDTFSVTRCCFAGDRAAVRAQACTRALELLLAAAAEK